jgi:hypothetical protein
MELSELVCNNAAHMDKEGIVKQLDQEIERLQQAKRILEGFESHGLRVASAGSRRGRRKMSKEARDRFAAAQRARWAKVKARKKK